MIPRDRALGNFLDSLVLMESLPDAVMLPAHGDVAPSTHVRAAELLVHHAGRLEETQNVVSSRPGATGLEVAGGMTWTRHQRRFDELDVFNQILAVNETVAHLKFLTQSGALTSSLREGPAIRYVVM